MGKTYRAGEENEVPVFKAVRRRFKRIAYRSSIDSPDTKHAARELSALERTLRDERPSYHLDVG